MKRVAQVCFVILLIVSASARLADAQESGGLTPRQSEIMRTVMDAQSGYIIRGIYDEFWSSAALKDEERQAIAEYLTSFMLKGQNYVRATWKSALLSLRAGRYTESDDYAQAKQESLDAFRSIPGVPSGPFEKSIARSEALISAAAVQAPFELGNGQTTYITEDLILSVISGIDGTLDRINLLVAPEWAPHDIELSLPEPSVKALMPWHLARSMSTQELENGLKVPMTSYAGYLDAVSFISFGYADFSGIDLPFDYRKGMFGAARGAFDGMGLTLASDPALEKWRGHDSIVAWGNGMAEGKPVAGYLRAFHVAGRKGLSTILLVREGSVSDLLGVVDAIEHKVAVIE